MLDSLEEILYNGDKYWIVRGILQDYAVNQRTHDTYAYPGFRYISITQDGSHSIKEVLAVIMLLKNDAVMSKFVPTLCPK